MDERIERIRAALSRHGATLQDVKPLHGGACQENFKVELTIDGAPLRLALRSDAPTSLPGSIKRKAEFAVINAAVSAGVKTPPVRWLESRAAARRLRRVLPRLGAGRGHRPARGAQPGAGSGAREAARRAGAHPGEACTR